MITPTIHLNGTSAGELQEGYERAYRALTGAIEALGQTAPNGRDYYPQGPDAILKAQREHDQRMKVLKSVQTDVLTLYNVIDAAT
jgi:hypothetical protein